MHPTRGTGRGYREYLLLTEGCRPMPKWLPYAKTLTRPHRQLTLFLHSMKRIVIFQTELLSVSQTFVQQQALGLKRWSPLMIGYRFETPSLSPNGLPIELIPGGIRRIGWFAARCRFWLGLADPAAVRLFRSSGASLVHVHFATDATEIWPSVKAAGLPMLITLHGYDVNVHREWWESGHAGMRWRTYPRRLVALSTEPNVHFLAVSKAIRDRAIEFGLPNDKISVSYIGINADFFRPDGVPIKMRPKRILFVGRLVPKKAPLLLVRVFADVLKKVPDAELIMVGEGPLRGAAEKLAMRLHAPIVFVGSQTSFEVLAHLREARVLCLPSVTAANGDAEGFGLVLLEAQAAGVPVVSSALGGSTEGLIDGVTGYRCSEGDRAMLAERLVSILVNDALAENMSTQGISFVKDRFSLKKLTSDLESHYDRVSGG